MLIFAEKDHDLREMFEKRFPSIETATEMFAVREPKVVVTCSNPWFTMAGGIDAVIRRKYPLECAIWEKERPNQASVGFIQQISSVLFTVTVDIHLKASEEGIKTILQYLWTLKDEKMPYVFTGMGCGIGGLSKERFVELCEESFV